MDLKEKKEKANALSPVLWIGKNGVTDSLIDELKKLLKKKKLVKIKLNRNFIENNDRKEIALDLTNKTKSELINVVGFNIVLYKK